MDVTKIREMIKDADDREARGKAILQESYKLRAEAQDRCPHSITYTTSSYFGGSYLDRASTTVYTHCALCEKSLGHETKQHSYYG